MRGSHGGSPEDERDVRTLEGAYDEAWTSGDVARWVSFFVPEAVTVTPYGDVWQGGITDIEEGLRAVMSQPSGLRVNTKAPDRARA